MVLASTLESLDSHISVTVEVDPSDLATRASNLAVVLASLNTFYEDRYNQMVTRYFEAVVLDNILSRIY